VFWFRKQGEGGLKIMLDCVWEQPGSDFAREDYSYLKFSFMSCLLVHF
jgi:hypothetical protein